MEIRFILFPETETETERERLGGGEKKEVSTRSLSLQKLSHSHFSSFSTAPFFTRALMMMMFFYSDASDAFTRNTRLDNKN